MHRTIRPTHRATTVAGAALVAGVLGAAAPATAEVTQSETTRERGYVLECQGIPLGRDHDHRQARVTLYENNRYGNELVITLDGRPRRTAITHPDDLVVKGEVRSAARIRGHRAVVVGNLGRDKRRTAVHEEHDDGGQLITVDGTHRRVRSDLGLLYRTVSFQLVCDPAFFYDLTVTRSEATDGQQ
ncbi:MAG: hypothetical protein CMJ44_14070 [Pimelobacter sp.]|nr:hypothetical protein [Pimelobacter sp.]